jgi:hypothetical protein
MNARPIRHFAVVTGLVALLSACGGGSDTLSPDNGSNSDKQGNFIAGYTAGLKVVNSYAGLSSAFFADLFDVAFLDAGNTQALAMTYLAQEAAATAASAELPLFPMVSLSAATITACNSADVCTLTATLSNNDVDASADNTNAVTFTTQVKYSSGKFRLLGDGAAS